MYSVVLMAALSAGGSAPDCHGHCHSCGGGYGGCYGGYGGCYGGCYGGYGGGYGGCYGGYGGGYGGCYGGYSYGSGYGCYGSYSCHGCYGCYGCYGCSGYAPMYGTPVMTAPVTPPPDTGKTPPPDMPPVDKTKKPDDGKETSAATKAKLIVELPADARLFIDDQPMKTPSAKRVFNTPTLQKGQAYFYDLRAEIVRDGKTITENKRVVVNAGAEIPVTFAELLAAAASAKTNVADAR
jgi:uncharacterized protein (TIGR03000 family)